MRHSGLCYTTLATRVPSFTTVDVETANEPEQVSNALYFVTVKADASTTIHVNNAILQVRTFATGRT